MDEGVKISALEEKSFEDLQGLGVIPVSIPDVGTFKLRLNAIAKQSYTHNQAIPADIWTINHNLERRPHVSVSLTDGSVIGCDVNHINDNTVTINLAIAVSGIAYLS